MDTFYPPQQRWLAQKLTLCCTFLLLFNPKGVKSRLLSTLILIIGISTMINAQCIDIHQTGTMESTVSGSPGLKVGQTFMATSTGEVLSISLGFAGGHMNTGPHTITIGGSSATPTAFGMLTTPASTNFTTQTGAHVTEIVLAAPYLVTAGNTYAFEITVAGSGTYSYHEHFASGGGNYADGSVYFEANGSFNNNVNVDLSFSVEVCPNMNAMPPTFDACPANIVDLNLDASGVVTYDYTELMENANGSTIIFSGFSTNGGVPGAPTDVVGTLDFDCDDVGAPVSHTAFIVYDDNGSNVNVSCPVIFNILDVDAPVFTAMDLTVDNDLGECSAEITAYPVLSATDNCPNAGLITFNYSIPVPSNFPVGVTPVTVTATDGNGVESDPQMFNVTVEDNEAPVFTACPTMAVELEAADGNCFAIYTYDLEPSDNCSFTETLLSGLPSGSAFPIGTTTISVEIADLGPLGDGVNPNTATCTFDVIVTEATPPEITCPDDITYNVDAGCEFVIPNYSNEEAITVSDNCGIFEVIQSPAPGTIISGHGTVETITMTVVDFSGNEASCMFDITLEDVTAPVFDSCPSTIAIVNAIGDCSATATWTPPTLTDNCDQMLVPVASHEPGDVFEVGTTVVTYTGTDAAGNVAATCSFTVIVVDNEDPIITCPADIVMDTDAGLCTAVVTYDAVTATDNCPNVGAPEMVHGLASGSAFPIGTTVVEYEVQDASGNRSVCSFTVTVEDNEIPVIEPTTPLTFSLDNNCEFVLPDFSSMDAIQFSDNCDIDLKITQTPPAGTVISDHGTVETITFTATDDAGNVSDPQTLVITVEDTEKPIVQLSGTTDVEVNSCEDLKTVSYTVSVDDNCDVDLSAVILSKDKVEDGVPFLQVGIPSSPYTFTLDLHPDDDGELLASYTDAGDNTGTNVLDIDVDKNRGACEIIKEEISICAGITGENTSKEVRWLEENIAIRAYEDQVWRVLISNGLYLSTDQSDRLNAGMMLTAAGAPDADDVDTFTLPALYHVSGEGYDLILINELGEMEFVSGFGVYPTLEITQLEEGYCLGSTLETIVFEADEMGVFEVVDAGALNADIIATRQIDNTFEVDINPNELGIPTGQVVEPYEIKVMFTGQHTVDNSQANGDKRPGCPVMLTAPFEVREYKLTCNDDVTVKIDNSIDCAVNVIPDMLIENHCSNNDAIYDIRILDPEGKIDMITGQNTDLVRLEGVTPGEYLFIIKVPTLKDSCWGFINIEDKDRPLCVALINDPTSLDPIEYSCTEDEANIVYDELDVNDFADCTGIDEVHSFEEKTPVCPGDLLPIDFTPTDGFEVCEYRKKSWFADDLTGKTSDTCFQYVFIVRPIPSAIKLDLEVNAACKDGLNEDDLKPYFIDLDGSKVVIGDGEEKCKYAATRETGDKVALCGTNGDKVYKQLNRWTVVDWCGDKLYDGVSQKVEVTDTEAPMMTAGRSWAQTSPFQCDATLTFDPATAIDCVGIDASTWLTVAQYVDITGHNTGAFVREENPGNGIQIDNVPVGAVVTVTYFVEDYCGNRNSVSTTHFAEDDSAPVCISNDELIVGLVKTDAHDSDVHMVGAKVYPEDIDDTSYDNCHPLIIEIRKASKHDPANPASLKDDEGWGEFVEYSFDSNEAFGDKCKVIEWVDVRVTEDRNGNGEIDEDEQYSICPSKITLIEQNEPEFTTDLDCKWVTCFEESKVDFDTPEYWGFCSELTYVDTDTTFHCPKFNIGCEGDFVDIASVKGSVGGVTGYRKRTWTLKKKTEHGAFEKQIEQYIYIREVIDEKFAFPQDVKIDCASDEGIPAPATLDEILTNKGCSEWVMNVTQDTFYRATDACLKIIRNYEFINWCRFDENLIDDNTQIDKDCADIDNDGKLTGSEQVVISTADIRLAGQSIINRPFRRCVPELSHNIHDLYLLSQGYFNYTQVIKIDDSVDPTGSIEAKVACDVTIDGCHQAVVTFEVSGSDICSDANFAEFYIESETGYGEGINDKFQRSIGTNTVEARGLPIGKYTIHAKIEDSCGNSIWLSETTEVEQSDCKKPTVIGLANFTALMENCTVDVWLSDILASYEDNCSEEYGAYSFALELANTGASATMPAANDRVTITSAGANQVALWMADGAGNTQYTLVPVIAQDNSGTCGASDIAAVSGKIVNEHDEQIDEVTVIARGTGMVDFTSIFDGTFNVSAIPMNADVTITAEKDINYMNGISTGDLVAIRRHLLGVTELQSAYKLISADVSGDNKVNTRDLLNLQKLILGVDTELANVNSWRFIPKDHTFTNPTSPWGFPEAIDFQSLDANAQADFIGLKIGDVTGNAKPTNLLGDDATFGTKQINIADAQVVAGKTTAIEFTAADFRDMTGYQFTINLGAGVAFKSVEPGVLPNMSDANFGLNRLDQGIITTSWSDVHALDLQDGDVLFTLNVVADQAGLLSSMINVSSDVTNAEAYDNDLNPYDLKANFIRTAGAEFTLYQNTPNPFNGTTTIGFDLPKAGPATLKVMDISGKTLKVINGEYNKGYNQIDLSAGDLNATGVLYYELTSSNASLTKKMVVLK